MGAILGLENRENMAGLKKGDQPWLANDGSCARWPTASAGANARPGHDIKLPLRTRSNLEGSGRSKRLGASTKPPDFQGQILMEMWFHKWARQQRGLRKVD